MTIRQPCSGHDYWAGVCPRCGRCDGSSNIVTEQPEWADHAAEVVAEVAGTEREKVEMAGGFADTWGYCLACRTRWWLESGSVWEQESPGDWWRIN
jgi:hypothetical protein